jgi:hypothetical protein
MPELLTLPKTARKTRPGGRHQIGTVGGFMSEWWAASNRNARADCVGIYTLVLFGWVTSTALVWWDTGTISKMQDEITGLQANHAAWLKAGMLGKLSYCDPGNRPCIQVDESAAAFATISDYRIILGYQRHSVEGLTLEQDR